MKRIVHKCFKDKMESSYQSIQITNRVNVEFTQDTDS